VELDDLQNLPFPDMRPPGKSSLPGRNRDLATNLTSTVSLARRPQHPVNQLPLLTRECENPEGENAGCGRNPDGCARHP
jgi:hypothetical protein